MADGYKTSDGKVFYESDNIMAKYQAEDHQRYLDGSGGSSSSSSRSSYTPPPLDWTYNHEGLELFNAGNYDEAILKFTKAIDHGGRNECYAYANRAICYNKKRNYDQAIADATSAINIGGNDASAYNVRGAAYKDGKGNTQQAIADWKEAAYLGDKDALDNLSKNGVQYSLANHIEEKIANRLHNDPKANIWYLADEWESATGRKMTKDEQVRIAGKPFPKRPKPSSSSSYSSSSYDEYSEGHPTLFGIIGAVVLGGIGYNTGRWVGAIIGGLIGWFVGRAIGSKISFGGGSSSHVGIGSKLLSVLFGIIGAVILTVIALVVLNKLNTAGMVNVLGLLGGPIVGFILGYKISRSLAGKLIIIAALIGGGLFFVWYNWSVLAPYFGKAQTVSETAATATVTSNVNFRAEPTTGDNIIRQLQQGDTVTLTGEVSGGWTQISHNGDIGWVSTEYLNK